mgnify:CR=1 FL=1
MNTEPTDDTPVAPLPLELSVQEHLFLRAILRLDEPRYLTQKQQGRLAYWDARIARL